VKYTNGCPTLAAFLSLRLGWETKKASGNSIQENLGAPGPSHLGTGDAVAGCPTLAAFLSLRLGWETTNANPNSAQKEFAQ
jgi:hypothetical protein